MNGRLRTRSLASAQVEVWNQTQNHYDLSDVAHL